MRHEYEFRYHYGVSPHPAIERADMTDDSQAAVRAVRELLCMPSRHAVEVWRDGVVIFWRSRIRPWPADPASSVETQHIGAVVAANRRSLLRSNVGPRPCQAV